MRIGLLTSMVVWVACTGASHVTTPGASVYNASVRKLQLDDRGGGFAGDSRDAPCDPNKASYTLTIAGHQLAWQYCEHLQAGDAETFTPRTGSRALDDSEWSALEPKLADLVVSGSAGCGADKPVLALIVTTDDGDLEYGDDFYGCGDRSKPYVVSSALDAALAAAGQLARK